MNNLITAGELAKLASTTKRTILFYDEKGILRPAKVNSKKYRFYEEKQVLDYQMILLLSTLGVPLEEIKKSLKKGNISDLFNAKKEMIKKEINNLSFNLKNLNKFMTNIKSNQTMVNPKIKILKPFGVYYIERICSYSEIGKYCIELYNMFKIKGKNYTSLAIFENPTYQPKKSLIKISCLAQKGMEIKEEYQQTVKYMKFNPGKVITYAHNGLGEILSLFWKELEKYCRLNNIQARTDVPDFEIYRKVNSDPSKQFFEIYLPIN